MPKKLSFESKTFTKATNDVYISLFFVCKLQISHLCDLRFCYPIFVKTCFCFDAVAMKKLKIFLIFSWRDKKFLQEVQQLVKLIKILANILRFDEFHVLFSGLWSIKIQETSKRQVSEKLTGKFYQRWMKKLFNI